MPLTALLILSVFGVTLLTACLIGYFYYVKPHLFLSKLEDSENRATGPGVGAKVQQSLPGMIAEQVGSLLPASPSESVLLRKELQFAGFRNESAVKLYAGIKVVSCALLFLTGILCRKLAESPSSHLMIPAAGLMIGLFGPGHVLGWVAGRRQERIRFALADALDMLVICCEAGCGLDQAIAHVARDFKQVHPDLADELALVNMETLAGVNRTDALRNLATRTGVDEVRKVAAILIQTDRFGTSVADALRTQADYMRVRRRQQAEERAGKVGVKLVFPIFFFFMPSLMVLVAGPGMLQMTSILKTLAKGSG